MNVKFQGVVSPENTSKEIGYVFIKTNGRKTCHLVQLIRGKVLSKEAMSRNKALAVMRNYDYNPHKGLTSVGKTITI